MLGIMKVDERFFATLMALNGQLDDVYTHSTLAYEDWSRQTWGGHPHDWQPEEVNTTLLFKARTDKGCSGARSRIPYPLAAGNPIYLLPPLYHPNEAQADQLCALWKECAKPVTRVFAPGEACHQAWRPDVSSS